MFSSISRAEISYKMNSTYTRIVDHGLILKILKMTETNFVWRNKFEKQYQKFFLKPSVFLSLFISINDLIKARLHFVGLSFLCDGMASNSLQILFRDFPKYFIES